MKRFAEEDGSFTVESVFVVSLSLVILMLVIGFAFDLHNRVAETGLALTARVEAESAVRTEDAVRRILTGQDAPGREEAP